MLRTATFFNSESPIFGRPAASSGPGRAREYERGGQYKGTHDKGTRGRGSPEAAVGHRREAEVARAGAPPGARRHRGARARSGGEGGTGGGGGGGWGGRGEAKGARARGGGGRPTGGEQVGAPAGP